jgi:SAM-dependent methyltransferase/ribosomal protein L31
MLDPNNFSGVLQLDDLFTGVNIVENPNVHIELEVKFKPYPVYKAKEYFDRVLRILKKNHNEIVEESTVYSYPNDVRKIVTYDSTTYERKTRLKDYKKYQDFHFIISISEEEQISTIPKSKPTYTRNRVRHSFIIKDDYRVDLTEILGNKPIYEIEMEYIGNIDNLKLSLLEEEIYYIYRYIYQSEGYVTPNQITNLVNQMNDIFEIKPQKTINKDITVKARNIQYRDLTYGGIVGNKQDEYVVSHKADGKDHFLILNNDGLWLVNSQYYNLVFSSKTGKAFGGELSIYKAEVITNKIIDLKKNETIKYYVLIYDCLVYRNEQLLNNTVWERIACIDPFIQHATGKWQDDYLYFVEKEVIDLSVDNFFEVMTKLAEEQKTLEYPTDGFIFTPSGKYNYHSDRLPLSQRDLHYNPDVCKWKPPSKITIDYRVVINQNNKIDLLVYDVYKKAELPFTGTQNYLITQDMIDQEFNDIEYIGKIVESYYDLVCHKIKPLKVRDDKDGPNRLDIAKANWYDVNNPILLEDLLGQSMTLVNKYHNQIKNIIYGLPTNYTPLDLKLPSQYNLLDIGGGRGGDLGRWSKSGVNYVITVEPNMDNLNELKLRLSDSDLKNKVTYVNTIGEDTEQITKIVQKTCGKVDVITLMLSLSFFWASEKHLDALVQTIVHNLTMGGYVLFFTITDQLEKELQEQNPLILNNASFTLYDDKYVRAEIPGIVGKQWEFIVKLNQLTLKLIQYGIVLKDKKVANEELLFSKDGKNYTELFSYGYYQKTKDVKVGKLKNIKLPKIIYPTIHKTIITPLKNDEIKPLNNLLIKNLVRIGTLNDSNNVLDAILKAYNLPYQEDNNIKIIEALRIELSQELQVDWVEFNYDYFPKKFVLQIANAINDVNNENNDIDDYSLLSLQHIFQFDIIPQSLFTYISYIIKMDIYIFTYDDINSLFLQFSTYSCERGYDAIFLLDVGNHYELLAQKTNDDKVNNITRYYKDEDDILYNVKKLVAKPNINKSLVKNYIKEVLGPKLPDLSGIIEENDPMYQLINESYVDIKLYIKGLVKTINKIYITPKNTEEKLSTIFKNNNIKAFKKLLSNLEPLTKKPKNERIEERISHIITILSNFNNHNIKVLDIGAGKGEIITAVKDYYKLPKENVFAIDQKLPDIKTVTALTYKNGLIPLPDKSIDVILLFAVLHHIPTDERLALMNEIKRVLSPNGIVIVREHDDDKDPNFYTFIDLIHQFWYFVEDESEDPLNMMSYTELLQLFDGVEMKSTHHDAYTGVNPQHLYHEAFMFKYQDDFPYKKYSMNIEDVNQRFENLKSYQFNFVYMPYTIRNIPGTWYNNKKLKYNNVIIKNEASDYLNYNLIADYWMDPCKMQAKRYDQELNPHQYWEQNKEYVKQEAYKNYGVVDAYTLRETIFKLAGEVTGFRITLMVGFIKLFKAKKILDISSGWGERLLGAINQGVSYNSTDPNSCLHPKYHEMIKHFAKDTKKYTMTQSTFEEAILPKMTYDLIFTSMPYYTLEKYTDEESQSINKYPTLDDWFDNFLIFSLNKAWDVLEVGGHMCINLNDVYNVANYCELMVNVFNDIHDDAEYLGVISYSEFVKGKPKNVQPIFVWKKI